MRGRKLKISETLYAVKSFTIKKESPNEGTETRSTTSKYLSDTITIKKESPNEGTETCFYFFQIV